MKNQVQNTNQLVLAALACVLSFVFGSDTPAQSITDGSTPLAVSPGARGLIRVKRLRFRQFV